MATRNMLSGHKFKFGMGQAAVKTNKINPTWVHLGVIGSGVVLGYVAYPYAQQPLGMTIMGAAGSVVAVGLLLLVYDLVREKSVLEITT